MSTYQSVETFVTATPITSSTYAYSEWVNARYPDLSVLFRVATLTATSLTFNIQGRADSNNYTHVASIYTIEIAAAQAQHDVINVTEKFGQIRVGAKIDITSTPNLLYAGVIQSESKY